MCENFKKFAINPEEQSEDNFLFYEDDLGFYVNLIKPEARKQKNYIELIFKIHQIFEW